MEPKKQAIIDALSRFIAQRPGIEFANYGDLASYRAESRAVTRDKHHAETLIAAVKWRDSITADMLLKASEGAYSGRLSITPGCKTVVGPGEQSETHYARIDYCAGQYFPTEYRKAVCAVLASALWNHVRASCMPPVNGYMVREWGNRHTSWGPFATRAEADAELKRLTRQHANPGNSSWGTVDELHEGKTAGDWLRAYFRREFGRTIAGRYFS